MRPYKFVYFLIQLVVLLVSGAILFALVSPLLRFRQAQSLPLQLVSMDSPAAEAANLKALRPGPLDPRSGFGWLASSLKLTEPVSAGPTAAGQIQLFSDPSSLAPDKLAQMPGRINLLDRLFSQAADSEAAANTLQDLTGSSYSGFYGQSFADLGDLTSIPTELIEQYQETSGQPWNFQGAGIVIRSTDQIAVLQKGQDYRQPMRLVDENGLSVPYYGLFEVLTGQGTASFQLDPTAQGQTKLSNLGIPAIFPALIEKRSSLYDLYYLAGDFASLKISVSPAFSGFSTLMSNKWLYAAYTPEEVYWRWFVPKLHSLIAAGAERLAAGQSLVAPVVPVRRDQFTADAKTIYRTRDGQTSPFFIKGVNLGAALPGRSFTEFPQEKAVYLDWLNNMADLNINTVRIYTLFPPAFYRALSEFNAGREQPIYLLQEIWPEENPVNLNYLDAGYNATYKQEIAWVVDALHGAVQIPARSYRAYGQYTADVTPYLLGYLVGRELEPSEVLATDKLNPGFQFTGNYVYSEPDASPTEAWLAQSCNEVLAREDQLYGYAPLTAIVSWPTLDPKTHDSEWNREGDKSKRQNDIAVVDINHIGINRQQVAGFFGAYHIYPNYPTFMNNEAAYDAYQDEVGRLRYGGYLQEFMAGHRKFPALVAEYGLSTSTSVAQYSPDGYHHGGLSEADQAHGIIRMTAAIRREHYAGAVIFEWMDEWAKKTWTTEPFMIPYDRHVYWSNVQDPEQNYGLIQNSASPLQVGPAIQPASQSGMIVSTATGQNEAWVQLDINTNQPIERLDMWQIAIDTIALPGEAHPIAEFILKWVDGKPMLLANPGYNWATGHYLALDAPENTYGPLMLLTNAENYAKDGTVKPAIVQNLSLLDTGSFDDQAVEVEKVGNQLRIRLPYILLGISDPSSRQVLSDTRTLIPEQHDQLRTLTSTDIVFSIKPDNEPAIESRLNLKSWDTPDYATRRKDSFTPIADYFAQID